MSSNTNVSALSATTSLPPPENTNEADDDRDYFEGASLDMADQAKRDAKAGIPTTRRKWCSISADNVIPPTYGGEETTRRGQRKRRPAANFFQEMARDDADVRRMLLEDIPASELAFALGDGDDKAVYAGMSGDDSSPDSEEEDPEFDGEGEEDSDDEVV